MLRHYDAIGLVRPTGRTVGDYREYSAEDVRRIFQVESLRTLGMSLAQIGRALEDPDFAPATLVSELIRWTEDRLAREQELLGRLRVIDASEPTDWHDVLSVIDLMKGLTSNSPARRQQAVLTRSGKGPVPVDVLVEAVVAESDPHVAGALRWALARAGGEGVATLTAAARSDDVDVRRRAVLALTDVPQVPGAIEALTEALGDPDATVRGRAAVALGNRGMTEAAPTLIAMVVEGSQDVEAAEALRRLSTDPEHEVLIATAFADELAVPTADSPTRVRLVQALIELQGPTAQEILRRMSRDDDRVVALVASTVAAASQELTEAETVDERRGDARSVNARRTRPR